MSEEIFSDEKILFDAELINNLGQRVRKLTLTQRQTQVPVADLAAGIYYCRISIGNKLIALRKIVKTG